MANRVEYIKISRIDENGNNLTNTLESLNQLTIPYSNGNNAVYPIESITRYSDYFLYQVGPANYTPNSADAGKLEYKFTSSVSTSTISRYFGFLDASAFAFYTIPLTTPTNDPFGFYNPNNGSYVFDTYSQKDLTLEITSSLLNNSSLFTTTRVSVFVVDPVSVTPNDILSQNGMLATELYGLFGTYPFNKTVTIPSESIAPGNEIRLILSNGGGGAGTRSIKFDPGAEFKISSTAATGPTLSTIPEPYLTSKFYGGDCDVLLNNVELYQENPFLQDLDYSTNPNVPVNFQLIISGTAARGTVPESYYTSLAQTTIRYIGSKNQSSNFNIYNPQAGTSSFGDNINIGTYGQTPSVDILDVNVYEFEWAGPTFPIIQDYGMFKMGKILQVSSKDLVKTLNPSDNVSSIQIPSLPPGPYTASLWNRSSSIPQSIGDYYSVLDSNNQPGTRISVSPYRNQTAGSNPVIPNTTRVLTPSFGIPELPSFVVTSSAHGATAEYGVGFLTYLEYNGTYPTSTGNFPPLDTGVPTTASFIRLHDNRTINFVKDDFLPDERILPTILISGSTHISSSYTASFEPLQDSLNKGERWFATFYNNFDSINTNLDPLVLNDTLLGKKGVAEIYGIAQHDSSTGTPLDIMLLLKDNINQSLFENADTGFKFINIGTNLLASSTGGTGGTAGTFSNVPVTNSGESLRVNVTTTAGDTLDVGSEILAGAGSIGGCGTGQTSPTLNSAIMLSGAPSPFSFTLETNGGGIVSKMIIQSAGSSGFDTNTVFTLTAAAINSNTSTAFSNFGNASGTDTFSVAAGNLEVAVTSVSASVASNSGTVAGDQFTVDAQDIGNASTNLVITAQSNDLSTSTKNFSYKLGGGSLGFFLWKARGVGKNEFILIEDKVTGQTSAGAFTTQFPPEYVSQNIENITKEYGSNTE